MKPAWQAAPRALARGAARPRAGPTATTSQRPPRCGAAGRPATMYSLILTLVLLRQMSFLSKSVYWVCEAKLQAGKTFDDLFDLCTANKKDISIILAAFAGILTRTKFMLLIEELQTESYAQARHIAKEQIEKNKLIEGYTLANKVRGSEKEIKKLETVGQKIFAYCPGLDAVLKLGCKSEDANAEATREIVLEASAVATKQLREGQQQQTNKIKKTVVEAATDIRDGVGKVLVTQSKVLVAEGRDNKKEIKETVNQRADEQMAFNAEILAAVNNNNALAEENRALRSENRALREQRAFEQSGQLALDDQAYGEPVQAELVEPSSGDGDTVGALVWTPRTSSTGIRVGLRAPSLLERDRSPESPESSESPASQEEAEAVPVAALDETFAVAPPLEAVEAASDDKAVAEAPSPVSVERGTPTGLKAAAAALDDDGTVAAAAPATPARVVSDWDKERLEAARSAWKQRRKKTALGEKYPSPPVRDCPKEGKKKDPNWCPDKLELSDVNPTP